MKSYSSSPDIVDYAESQVMKYEWLMDQCRINTRRQAGNIEKPISMPTISGGFWSGRLLKAVPTNKQAEGTIFHIIFSPNFRKR